jgi:hypothetical protein
VGPEDGGPAMGVPVVLATRSAAIVLLHSADGVSALRVSSSGARPVKP